METVHATALSLLPAITEMMKIMMEAVMEYSNHRKGFHPNPNTLDVYHPFPKTSVAYNTCARAVMKKNAMTHDLMFTVVPDGTRVCGKSMSDVAGTVASNDVLNNGMDFDFRKIMDRMAAAVCAAAANQFSVAMLICLSSSRFGGRWGWRVDKSRQQGELGQFHGRWTS